MKLEEGLDEVNRRLRSHAGRVEIIDVSDDGVATVTFCDMCAGCLFRPMTLAALVRPILNAVDGISDVAAAGVSVSPAALDRLSSSLEYGPAVRGLSLHPRTFLA